MHEVVTDNLDLWTSALLTKSAAGRGNNGKHDAYGIKKLRELILELAVRGKLLPQDPKDEPASQLLRQNAQQRDQLEKLGRIRRQKELPAIAEGDKKFDRPDGWEWVKLGQLMEMFNGRAFKSTEWGETGLPIIRIQNLNDPTATFNYFVGEVAEQHLVHDGTFLISWSGTPGTSFGAFIWNRGPAALNQHINKCLIFLEDADLHYLKLSVNSCMDHLIARAQGGVGLKHVTRDTLDNIVFGYPPLAEQRRIVTKVNELMALCDQLEQQQSDSIKAHETLVETLLGILTQAASPQELTEAWTRIANHFDTLFATEHSIDQLKQTILELAVMGKLLPQDPADEPARILIDRIIKYKQVLKEKGQFRQSKVSRPPTALPAPVQLPLGWEWTNVDTLCFKVTDGTHFTPRYVSEGVRFVSAKDVVKGRLVFGQCKFISQEEHEKLYRRCNPEHHDIVITKSGSIGTVALIEDYDQFSLFEILALLKFDQSNLSPNYLTHALSHACSSLTTGHIRGMAVKHLHLDLLRGIELALPPLPEQHRIVAKVDELMTLCDVLKAHIKNGQSIQIHLADAIAEQAVAP